jgi:hypothetical protein
MLFELSHIHNTLVMFLRFSTKIYHLSASSNFSLYPNKYCSESFLCLIYFCQFVYAQYVNSCDACAFKNILETKLRISGFWAAYSPKQAFIQGTTYKPATKAPIPALLPFPEAAPGSSISLLSSSTAASSLSVAQEPLASSAASLSSAPEQISTRTDPLSSSGASLSSDPSSVSTTPAPMSSSQTPIATTPATAPVLL